MNDGESHERFSEAMETAEDLQARLAVRTPEGWIDREELIEENDEENHRKYVLDASSQGERRYSMTVVDGGTAVEEWRRYTLPIKRIVGSDEPINEDIDVIAELSVLPNRTAPTSPPWESDEVVLSSTALGRKSEFPPVNIQRVAGLEEEKQRLESFLDESEEGWGLDEATGVILEGPPGTGKTELMMEVCQERYGSMPVMISGPEILSKWVGESERMLREKFDEAWNTKHRVLYIDELDAIARARSEVSESYSAQIVAQLLVLLDGVEAKQQAAGEGRSLKVVASTNLSHVVDPALRRPGRLGNRPIRFSRPGRFEREAILHHYFEKVLTSESGSLSESLQTFVKEGESGAVDGIIERTEGFTGADLEDLVRASVSRLKEMGLDTVDVGLLENILEYDGFGDGRDIEERELKRSELANISVPDSDSCVANHPAVHILDEGGDPLEIARQHFKRIEKEADLPEDIVFKFRTVGPKEMLDSDSMRAKENTVQAFHHREDERLCLYLRNIESLLRGKENSALIDRLVGVINEEFLQWDDENVLIVDPISEDRMADFLRIE